MYLIYQAVESESENYLERGSEIKDRLKSARLCVSTFVQTVNPSLRDTSGILAIPLRPFMGPHTS